MSYHFPLLKSARPQQLERATGYEEGRVKRHMRTALRGAIFSILLVLWSG